MVGPHFSGIEAVRVPQAVNVDGLEMTGVDPTRLRKVRHRIAALKSYLRLETPDDADKAHSC